MRRFLNAVRHVLVPRLCRDCRGVVEESLLSFEESRRAYQRLRPEIQRQRLLASRSCDALLAEPKEDQVARVRGSYSRYGTRPVVEELLKRSLQAASADPEEAHHLAELAQEAGKKILGREALAGGERALADLNALAQAHLGNACRTLRRRDEAEAHFRAATVFLIQGTGDPQVFGGVYSLYGSHLLCRRELKGALHLLREAERAYRRVRDGRGQAKVLLKQALVLEDLRDDQRALAAIEEALPFLTGPQDRRLRATAYHHLASMLCSMDRAEEAEDALDRSEELFRRLPPCTGSIALRRVWVRAKVSWGVGELERAEELFLETLAGFRHSGDPFRSALVSLDLAGLYAQQDRLEDLLAMITATHEGLMSEQLEPEAAELLDLLVKSAQRRQLTLAVIRAAASKLRPIERSGASC